MLNENLLVSLSEEEAGQLVIKTELNLDELISLIEREEIVGEFSRMEGIPQLCELDDEGNRVPLLEMTVGEGFFSPVKENEEGVPEELPEHVIIGSNPRMDWDRFLEFLEVQLQIGRIDNWLWEHPKAPKDLASRGKAKRAELIAYAKELDNGQGFFPAFLERFQEVMGKKVSAPKWVPIKTKNACLKKKFGDKAWRRPTWTTPKKVGLFKDTSSQRIRTDVIGLESYIKTCLEEPINSRFVYGDTTAIDEFQIPDQWDELCKAHIQEMSCYGEDRIQDEKRMWVPKDQYLAQMRSYFHEDHSKEAEQALFLMVDNYYNDK